MNYCKVVIGGNLTRDPEVRFGPSGTAIVKFGIAVNRNWTTDDGEKKTKPVFIDVTMFGKRGEAFARFHRKGAQAFLEGRLELDIWDDKQTGQKRQKLYIVAEGWEFVGSRETAGSDAAPTSGEGSTPMQVDESPF
jgi:single-strand DNA-binding protein